MSTQHHARAVALEDTAIEVGDGKTVTVRVVSWNTDYRVSDNGRDFYTERYVPGGLNMRSGAELVATSEHDPRLMHPDAASKSGSVLGRNGVPVGRITATHIRADGLYADVRLFDSLDGDSFRRYVRSIEASGRPFYVSPEFEDEARDISAGDTVERVDATLIGLAFTLTPQYGDARVIAVRSTTHSGETLMSDENTTAEPDLAGTDTHDTPSDDMSGAPSPAPAAAVTRSQPAPAPRTAPRPGDSPITQASSHFRSFGHFAQAVASGNVSDAQRDRFARAFDTSVLADATGLVQDEWVAGVIDLYRTLTPAVNAFRQRALPSQGNVVNQPVVSVRPTVDAQASEFTEPSSTSAEITTATWSLATYAGGNNVSIQTLMRTDPAYLDELMRLYVREMALDINGDVVTELIAQADSGDSGTNAPLEYVDAVGFDELLFDASAVFLDTMHRPAEVLLMSVDLWLALGKAKDTAGDFPLYPAVNPFNRQGSLNTTSPSGNIVGLDWYVEPALGGVGDGVQAIVGVRDAWVTYTSPMGTLQADTPATLGRSVAVYQFAAFGATDNTGLIFIEDAV